MRRSVSETRRKVFCHAHKQIVGAQIFQIHQPLTWRRQTGISRRDWRNVFWAPNVLQTNWEKPKNNQNPRTVINPMYSTKEMVPFGKAKSMNMTASLLEWAKTRNYIRGEKNSTKTTLWYCRQDHVRIWIDGALKKKKKNRAKIRNQALNTGGNVLVRIRAQSTSGSHHRSVWQKRSKWMKNLNLNNKKRETIILG